LIKTQRRKAKKIDIKKEKSVGTHLSVERKGQSI